MKLDFSYDEERDVFMIEGVKWSGELLRAVGVNGVPVGSIIKIDKRDDGIVTFDRMYDTEQASNLMREFRDAAR